MSIIQTVRDIIESPEPFAPDFMETLAVRLSGLLQPDGSFVDAKPRFHKGRWVIAAWIKHRPTKNPPAENPRLFDVLYFAAMLLMNVSGRGFYLDVFKDGLLYVRFNVSNLSGERVFWARVIRNTPPDIRTPFAANHYSYLYAELTLAPPDRHVPDPELGRPEAIALARKLYEKKPLSGLSADAYETLLNKLFELADWTHGA